MAHSADTEFSSPAEAPARKAGWVHAHCARLRSPYAAQDKPFASGSTNPDRKGSDIMLKINYMSTLFVGIDVSSKSNAVYAMDFEENKYISSSFGNNQPGADELAGMIADCMQNHKNLDTVIVCLESTSVYSVHIANFLSTCEMLMPYKPYVFVVNPKTTANYRKSYIGMEKTDPADAFLIADFARVGRTKKLEPWRGSQFIALKRLTRHRMHLSECIAREKTYMVSNLYLKFSELQLLDGDHRPFGNIYGTTSSAVLTEFLSPQEIIDLSEEQLLAFLAEKSRNRIPDISRTSELLRKAARNSYRLDKCMYEPLNVSLASSFNCIQAYQKEIKLIEQAIEKCINGINPNAFLILKSIPGIGPVWASGILSEIGDITPMPLPSMQACTGLKTIPVILLPKTTLFQKPEIPICAIIWEKPLTASGGMCLNMRITMPKNMLRFQSISTREHSRLHLVNLYDSFLDCWSKTNCTLAKSWAPN